MKRRKLKNRLAKRVLVGKITVDDARRRLGRSAVQKSAGPAWPAQPPAALRYADDDQYIRAAFGPISRPAVTKAAVPVPRETPLQALKSYRGVLEAPDRARPPHYWTGIELGLLRESQTSSDPAEREAARAALAAELERTA
jgi:hypothetical protein